MSFETDVISNPRALIKPIVENNTADVAHNMSDIAIQDLTKNGYLNVLTTLWDSGQKARVLNIINVAYIHSNGPDFLADYMAKYAQANDTLVGAYNRHVMHAKGVAPAAPLGDGEIPAVKDKDPGRNISVAALMAVLLVIFIFYGRYK